jgi:hypothetical protein
MKGNTMCPRDRLHLLEESPIQGFLSFLGGFGMKPFQDAEVAGGDGESEAVGPCLTGVEFAAERLEKDAAFLGLHPRVRHAIIMGDAVNSLSRRMGSAKSRAQSDVAIRRMTRKTERSNTRKELAQKVADLGIEEVRKQCVPAREKKQRKNVAGKCAAKKLRKPFRKAQPNGARRTQIANKFAAEVKSFRVEMEKQTAILKTRVTRQLCVRKDKWRMNSRRRRQRKPMEAKVALQSDTV